MSKREQLSNGAVSTLPTGINDSVTSLTVVSATGFPSDGNFRILVESELMLVTAVSGTTFTVVRGIESTSAASHLAGVSVLQVFTAGSLNRVFADNIPMFGATQRPLFGSLTDASGNVLDSSDFTVYNQNGATITDLSTGGIGVTHITNSGVMLSRTITTPKTITAAIMCDIQWENGSVGIGFRQNSNNRGSHIYQISPNSGTGFGPRMDKIAILQTSAPSTFNAHIVAPVGFTCARPPFANWFRISDAGTLMVFEFSPDGVNWTQIGTKNHSYLTPDRAHFYVNPFGTGTRPLSAKLVYWREE